MGGDTHGQLEDVLWMFFKHGLPSLQNRYLFNGDIVDRGGHALEILLLLFAFKRGEYKSVYILRGNHEDPACNYHFGFAKELSFKFGPHSKAVLDCCHNTVFPLLPIAATVTGAKGKTKFCVMHGGPPVGDNGKTQKPFVLDDFRHVDRRTVTFKCSCQGLRPENVDDNMLWQILWNDPGSVYDRGVQQQRGKKYDRSRSRQFCEQSGMDFVVRSHQLPATLNGVEVRQRGSVYTVFSASDYMGTARNWGGVFICGSSKHGLKMQVAEHWAPDWPALAANITKANFEAPDGDRQAIIKRLEKMHGKAFRTSVKWPGPVLFMNRLLRLTYLFKTYCRCNRRHS